MSATYALTLTDSELRRYAAMAAAARAQEGPVWAQAGIVPGATVADIGCGPGAVAAEVAEVVGPRGRVIAVDQDPDAVAVAADLAAARGLRNVTARQGDAAATGIAPGTVDTVMVRHVLAHTGGREPDIVAHAASLVRPGGAVLLVDVDLTAHRIDPPDDDWDDLQARYVGFHRRRGNDPSVGLRLRHLLVDAGLDVVDHRGWYWMLEAVPGLRPPAWIARDALVAEGSASAADVERWASMLDALDARPDPPTIFIPLFAAIGVRPQRSSDQI
jgi:SAM-dependent methyltransferase